MNGHVHAKDHLATRILYIEKPCEITICGWFALRCIGMLVRDSHFHIAAWKMFLDCLGPRGDDGDGSWRLTRWQYREAESGIANG